MTAAATQAYLHERIPLAKAMGVAVEDAGPGRFVLTAPLEPNHNHLGTAFGGSLAALATLAGYGFLWLETGDRGAHVVIRNSTLRFRNPVRGILRAVCESPGGEALGVFRERFAATGKAAVTLAVTIEDEGRVCVEFEGIFVAMGDR